jgi:hypothetical protein
MNGNVKSLKLPLSGPEKWKLYLGKTNYKKCEISSSLYTVFMSIQLTPKKRAHKSGKTKSKNKKS